MVADAGTGNGKRGDRRYGGRRGAAESGGGWSREALGGDADGLRAGLAGNWSPPSPSRPGASDGSRNRRYLRRVVRGTVLI